jgi:hypothetical protein
MEKNKITNKKRYVIMLVCTIAIALGAAYCLMLANSFTTTISGASSITDQALHVAFSPIRFIRNVFSAPFPTQNTSPVPQKIYACSDHAKAIKNRRSRCDVCGKRIEFIGMEEQKNEETP